MRAVAALPCCFLRVREGGFSGAAFCLSPWLCFGFLLLRPFVSLCSAGVVAIAPSGTLSHALQGLCPLTPLGLCPRPRQGYRALDCGMRFALGLTALFVPPTVYV